MVLQTSSFGFPQQQGYAQNEGNHYSNGSMHNNAYYGNSSSMQMMRPDSYSHGGFSNHGSHGYGGGPNHSSGMYSHLTNGSMNHGFGAQQSSHLSMGPGGYQYAHQQNGHNISSSPYGYNSHTWASKDLDD